MKDICNGPFVVSVKELWMYHRNFVIFRQGIKSDLPSDSIQFIQIHRKCSAINLSLSMEMQNLSL